MCVMNSAMPHRRYWMAAPARSASKAPSSISAKTRPVFCARDTFVASSFSLFYPTCKAVSALALDALPADTRGLSLPAQPEAYAHGLYAALRELDSGDAACILIEQPPSGPDWLAVNDRIKRALAGAGV